MPKAILLFLSCLFSMLLGASNRSSSGIVETNPHPQTISFTENKGQVSDQNHKGRPDVLYSGVTNGMVFHLRKNGISYQFNRVDTWKEEEDPKFKKKRNVPAQSTIYRTDINWLNSNQNAMVLKDEELNGYTNYYLEVCPNGALNVKSYTGITYKNIYKNIDLHYYEKDGNLKYDYIVAPHADYKQIQLEIKGVQKIELQKDGSVILKTPLGEIKEGAPLVFQNGVQLKAYWMIKNNSLKFEIEKYDPSFPLLIDPLVRLYGTYYGGSGADFGQACALDNSGNVFLTGYTSTNTGSIIASSGAYQTTIGTTGSQGSYDAYLVKFDAAGNRLWGTYYGASSDDYAFSCAVDASSNVYMCGHTLSGSVISSASAHQPSLSGTATFDAFLVKFNTNGVRQWGTYYGGDEWEIGNSCSTDLNGNVYMCGTSSSSTHISASGHQNSSGGPTMYKDAFLVKFNNNGVRQWGTYYGGYNVDDAGYSCSTDASGNVYMSGNTETATGTVIATPGSHQSTYAGGIDAFLVKFNSSGVRQWGTYYGDASNDWGTCCSIGYTGSVYLTGLTSWYLGNVLATANCHQGSPGGNTDGYLAKFDNNGVRQWGTYYGGTDPDVSNYCSEDIAGNIFMCGYAYTSAANIISTAGSYQSVFGGGNMDAFIVKFNSLGVRQWGTYYGGNTVNYDEALVCISDVSGNLYVAGTSNSTNQQLISSNSAYQSNYGGGFVDAFLVKFNECINPLPTITNTLSLKSCANQSVQLNASATGTINWYSSLTSTAALASGSTYLTSALSVGTHSYYIEAYSTCPSAYNRLLVTVTVNPLPVFTIVGSNNMCFGSTVNQLITGTAINYSWSNGFSGNFVTLSPTISTIYTVTGSDINNCISTQTKSITVNALPIISVNSGSICEGNSFTITPSGAASYTFSTGNSIISPSISTAYSVTGTSSAGCVSYSPGIGFLTVNPNPVIYPICIDSLICSGETSTITAVGAPTYSWSNGMVAPSIYVLLFQSTTFTLAGSNTAGCTSTAVITQKVDACTGLSKQNGEEDFIRIYPNPSKGEFVLEILSKEDVTIVNALGQFILNQTLTEGKNKLDLTNYTNGIYFIQFKGIHSNETVKLIKE